MSSSGPPPAGDPVVDGKGRRGRGRGDGLLFIVSAPSGAGKTTLVERLVEQTPRLRMSRSYTSGLARGGERDARSRLTRHRAKAAHAENR